MDAQSIERQQNTKPSSLPRWCLAPVIILLIYIFGSGPASRLEAERVLSFKVVGTIYWPLNSFCFAHKTTTKIYCWYLKLWGVRVWSSTTGQPVETTLRTPYRG